MSVKINSLEIENVKRIKAVKLEPSASGLTIIGGNNNQGKTSVLDAIAWALGGDKYKPTAAARDGEASPELSPAIKRPVARIRGEYANARITNPIAAEIPARTAGSRGSKRSVRKEAKKTDKQ